MGCVGVCACVHVYLSVLLFFHTLLLHVSALRRSHYGELGNTAQVKVTVFTFVTSDIYIILS